MLKLPVFCATAAQKRPRFPVPSKIGEIKKAAIVRIPEARRCSPATIILFWGIPGSSVYNKALLPDRLIIPDAVSG